MKAIKKPKKVWLARCHGEYLLFSSKPKRYVDHTLGPSFLGSFVTAFCSKEFESIVGIQLEPNELICCEININQIKK